jgi:hypothetical protein
MDQGNLEFLGQTCKDKGKCVIDKEQYINCIYAKKMVCAKSMRILAKTRNRGGKKGISMIKLHDLKPIAGQKMYCGPTVISALSGKSYQESLVFIKHIVGPERAREIKWMTFDELHLCISKLGFSAYADCFKEDRDPENFPTLQQWIRNRDYIAKDMGDDPEKDTWVLHVTNHFVVVQGNWFLDSYTKVPVPIEKAPGLKKLVRNTIKVETPGLRQEPDLNVSGIRM